MSGIPHDQVHPDTLAAIAADVAANEQCFTVLVAVDMRGHTFGHAQQRVSDVMESALDDRKPNGQCESWHLAEDAACIEQNHGSQPAVFCAIGKQAEARAVLVAAGLG